MTVDSTFCPRCGGRLAHQLPTTCGTCGYAIYVNARPTGTAIILAGDDYLAVRRVLQPQAGRWDLPGGFAEGWELPGDAAVREAREELAVDIALRDFVGMYIGAYEYQNERLPVLDCFWTASIIAGDIVLDPTENDAFTWFPLHAEPHLAFDTMNRAIADLRQRV
jgi:8-oxo-dGTP diphosphatase